MACCKLPCLLFDTSLTCEGKSLSTFRSFPTRVCQLKFAVWRPLNIQVSSLTKNEKCKPEIRNEVSFFSPSPSPPPQLSLIRIFHFCSPPTTKWWQINQNITCTCRVYLRPRWMVNFPKKSLSFRVIFILFVCFIFLSSYILNNLRDGEIRCSDHDKAIRKDPLA